MKMLNFFKSFGLWMRPRLSITLHAMAMAVLIILPLILYPFLAKDSYQGINIAQFGTDQHFYLSRARDILDGQGPGNSILREGKDERDPFATWAERSLLAPFRWLGVGHRINVVTLYAILNALGIFALTLLIYSFVEQLSGDKRLATLAAIFVIGGSSFVFYRRFFYDDMNIYGRAVFPYISSLAIFTYLNFLVRYLKQQRRVHLIAATITFGALFYIYLFAWTYTLTLTGIIFGLYLIRRDWKKAFGLGGILAGGLVLGSFNLIKLFSFLRAEGNGGLSYFHFTEHTHAPMFSLAGVVLLLIFGAYWWKNQQNERLPMIGGVILAGWVVLNQQILTGIRIQPGHYYWYFIVPLGIVCGLFMVWSLLPARYRKAFFVLVMLAVYVNFIGGQYFSALKSVTVKNGEQRFLPVLQQLRQDPKPSVVLMAADDHSYLVTIYTQHDIFWHDAANLYQANLEHMKNALLTFMLLNTSARQDPKSFLEQAAENKLTEDFYSNSYHAIEGFTSGYDYYEYQRRVARHDATLLPHRQQLIQALLDEFKTYFDDPQGLVKLLRQYGVKYVVWDEVMYPDWDMGLLPENIEILNSQKLHVYRLEE